jgi:capsular exopolysaccharide synthesis family protein
MSYLNNHNPLINTEEQEVDLKEIVAMLLQYKKSIFLVTFTVILLAGLVAYFKPNVYQANLTLQIQESTGTQSSSDFMAAATGMPSANMGNEVVLLKSRFIAKKVLEKVQIGNRYYDVSGYKNVELYTASPFTVQADTINQRLIGAEFHLTPLDKTHFRLIVKQPAKGELKEFAYDKIHTYGQLISTPLFSLTVNQFAPLSGTEYTFTITPNDFMYSLIQSSLSVTPSEDKGSVLMLGYQDNVPQRAQDILNAIATAYSEQSIKNKSNSAEKTLNFIDDQLKAIDKALQDSATNLKDYKSSHILIDVASKAGIASKDLDQYQIQMSEIGMQESTIQTLLTYVKANKDIVGIDLGPVGGGSTTIANLIQKIQELHTLHSSLLVDFTEKHPSVLKVNQQLASLKASLIATLEGSLRSIEQRKATLGALINKHSASLAALPEEEQQLTQLNRNFIVNEDIYKFLLQKRAETAIIESSTVSGVRVIDDALSNGIPAQPNRFLIVAMGFIIGLILGILQAFTRNMLANKIQTIGDIEGKTTLPIYSVLPLFKNKTTLYEDALRVLLTRLEYRADRPKIITFTSSVQGEGRTTTTLEFAKIIGQSGKKVIILDLDMRASRVKDKLFMTNDSGMSTYLAGNNTLAEVVKPVNEHVDVVVAGPIPMNPYEMIVSQKFKTLLSELTKTYDYILLESPPVGLVADALVLMRMSDLNLIVFKAGYSKKDFIKNTNRFVHEHELSNVGLILNALELKKIRPWLKK